MSSSELTALVPTIQKFMKQAHPDRKVALIVEFETLHHLLADFLESHQWTTPWRVFKSSEAAENWFKNNLEDG